MLRIISMLMVVVLHILGHGGVLKNTVQLSTRYEAAWFLEIAALCAVNCYALISGYVGVDSKFKYTNIIYIWLQVAFFNVLINFVGAIIYPNIGVAEVIKAFFPVSYKAYWYFTAYFCIFFFIPVINKGINALTKKQLLATATALLALFCLLPIIPKKDVFGAGYGYNAIWLLVLYIFGAVIKKAELFKKAKPYTMFLMYFVVIVITWAYKLLVDVHNIYNPNAEPIKNLFIDYTSPTILFAAIFMFVGFSKLKIGALLSKVIAVAAPVSFGVYLIHDNPIIRNNLISKIFANFVTFRSYELVVMVLLSALAIYVICGLIDYLRERLFKLLRVKKLIMWAEERLTKNIWHSPEK